MTPRRLLQSAVLGAAAVAVTGATAASQPIQATSTMRAGSPITASSKLIKQMQAALKAAGIYRGAVDGVIGRQTQRALSQYQSQAGLYPSGQLDQATIARLLTAATVPGATVREAASPAPGTFRSLAVGSNVPPPGNAVPQVGNASPPISSGVSESAAAPRQPSTSAGGTASESVSGGELLSLSQKPVPPFPDNPQTERGLVRATEITEQKLYSEKGGTFAQIEDLLIDPAAARVTGVIVDRQDTSGNYTGERLVIPLGDIKLTQGGWAITNLAGARSAEAPER